MIIRGRHWDPSPNPKFLGLGLGSIFQNFGIGIGTGIDFSKFWDWDWDSFFLKLGLGLGFFCRPLVLYKKRLSSGQRKCSAMIACSVRRHGFETRFWRRRRNLYLKLILNWQRYVPKWKIFVLSTKLINDLLGQNFNFENCEFHYAKIFDILTRSVFMISGLFFEKLWISLGI